VKLNIKSSLVAAIAQFKAARDIRFYLHGVYVEALPTGGVLIVGTNGHVLGVWRDLSGEIERPAILRIGRPLQVACAGAGRRLKIIDDRLAVVDQKGAEIHIQNRLPTGPNGWEIVAKYPDCRMVFKGAKSETTATPMDSINPLYVALVNRALSIGSPKKGGCIMLSQAETKGVITILSPDEPDFIAGIMPMLGKPAVYPEWIKAATIDAPLPGQQPSDAIS